MVKVVLASQYYWRRALANTCTLRAASVAGMLMRRSVTAGETKREFEQERELNQLPTGRNKGKARREWVIYRSQLRHISELQNVGSVKA